jgi:superfamily II DNA or RNA helicase
MYRAWTARLSDEEMADWSALAKQASRLRAQLSDGDTESSTYNRLKRVLIERARIVKSAKAKVPLAVAILREEYKAGQHWLVYCDDTVQMSEIQGALAAAGIDSLTFHSEMKGDREQTLEHFTVQGGILLAIKCLDEGVDIPVVSHALVLASSKNPREFIQRRGRVLRQAAGKSHASLHDVVVLASRYDDPDGEIDSDPVLAGELGRALEFAGGAMNPGAEGDLRRIVLEAGMKPDEILGFGDEHGDEEETEE